MTRRPRESFADTIARVKARPSQPPRVPAGRHGYYWGDPDRNRYELVTADLSPDEAVALARGGARVVYDACGCGGEQCQLDWLSADDVSGMVASGPPVLHPSKHGGAALEHWHSADGHDLVVAAVEISWGDRIRG